MYRFGTLICMLTLMASAAADPLPSVAEASRTTEQHAGYIDFFWDAKKARILLRIDTFDQPFLYIASLASGLGSNDVGLDRGQLGTSRVVRFKRVGPRVLLVQDNLDFRADSDNPDERRAVDDAFATSVLAGMDIVAEDPGEVLVDATPFLLSDQHGLVAQLRSTGQGDFKLDAQRSAVWMAGSRNFPDNTVVEVLLTLTSSKPGRQVREVTPTPQAVSLREQHAFIHLPDAGYTPREYDPRSGFFAVGFADYAAKLNQPLHRRLLVRHRLKPGQKLVYYVDRGVPEPVRSALMEGAGWWAQAFAAAGFPHAFEVKLLPKGVDPLDIRYNVIQWVHRASRGWSYGASVVDPRTGEIIQGHITLGSLRVRQDMRIARSLVAASDVAGQGDLAAQRLALARLRQLAVHEVGHTLGLAHNFAASTSDHASVMDYPYPDVSVGDHDRLRLDHVYARGVGAWDKLAIQIGYAEPKSGESITDYTSRLLSTQPQLHYLSDPDARAPGTAVASASLWDNGANVLDNLHRVMRVRKLALANLDESVLRAGEPLFNLQQLLTPIYLYHRYQVQTVAKLLGGRTYNYSVHGGVTEPVKPVAARPQRTAMTDLLKLLAPDNLALPQSLLDELAPPPPGYRRDRELLPGFTNPVFDPLAAAQTAARIVVSKLLDPARAARLYAQHVKHAKLPGLGELVDELLDATAKQQRGEPRDQALSQSAAQAVVDELLRLAADAKAAPPVRSIVIDRILKLQSWLEKHRGSGALRSWRHAMVERLRRFRARPWDAKSWPPVEIPPGEPI